MKLYFALPFLIVCFVLVSCSDDNDSSMTDNGNQEPFVITSEIEYAVYRAVIEEMYVHDERKLIVIVGQTFFNPDYVIGAFESPDILNVSPETLDSFQKRNQQPQAIDCTKLVLSVPCASDEISIKDGEHPRDYWDRFYEKYPGSQGSMSISRVGFNTDGSEALVYVGNYAYDLAGEGFHVLLVRKGDTWVVHRKETAWIS